MADRATSTGIFHCILRDHRKIECLFEESFAIRHSPATLALLYHRIRDELRVHGQAEEDVLYPFLKRTRDTEGLAHEAGGAHDRIDNLLDELDRLPVTETAWRTRFARLRSQVYQHVAREESDVFPHLRRFFPESALSGLCERFERAREQASRALHAA